MNIDKRWLLATAALGAAAGAAAASQWLRRRQVLAHHRDDSTILDWENEGGNLEPHPAPVMEAHPAGL